MIVFEAGVGDYVDARIEFRVLGSRSRIQGVENDDDDDDDDESR
jgi:hypothetical protein